MKDIYILAIETSCDETSMAIVKNGNYCVDMVTSTQIKTHEKYGGVVPEIASRMHTEMVSFVYEELMAKTNIKENDIDAIAVTYSPGLMGSLLVGVETAKAISYALKKPLIAVNHMAGHIYANKFNNDMNYPLLALVVSGGHTDLVLMEDDYKFKLLGSTLDDAIGEAYDKVAKVLDLPYPGGPQIENISKEGKPTYKLSIPMNNDSYNFSYSGLKSNIINLVHNEKQKNNEINKPDLAASFQTVAVDQLVRKVRVAINNLNVKDFLIAGGVSANKYLREQLTNLCNELNVKISVPEFKYCTDNAAMIGAAAYPLFLKKQFSSYDLNAKSHEEIY